MYNLQIYLHCVTLEIVSASLQQKNAQILNLKGRKNQPGCNIELYGNQIL